jgi:hypothetical protein
MKRVRNALLLQQLETPVENMESPAAPTIAMAQSNLRFSKHESVRRLTTDDFTPTQ